MLDQTHAEWIADYLAQSDTAMRRFCADRAIHETLGHMGTLTAERMQAGGKLLTCGNGGSAGDAQHIAGEFVSRLMYDRAPLPALALTTDSSALTAIGNDYGYEHVFDRQIRGLGRPGDIMLGISTSGRSPNILRAMDSARAMGILVLGFAGEDGRDMRSRCDLLLEAPSGWTPIIQQIHIAAAHVYCAIVERILHPQPPSP